MRSADILGRCASITTLSRPHASTFGSVSGVATGLRVEVTRMLACERYDKGMRYEAKLDLVELRFRKSSP